MLAGTLIISMIKCLQKIIDEFTDVLRGTKSCPAGDKLFKIKDDDYRELLTEEMARKFHQTMTQLLFLCKRAIPDIETHINFILVDLP